MNHYKKPSCCVSLCVSGTPVSDTVCKHCPAGHFSSSDSLAEPCQPHRNCSHLGLRTLRWGSATSDSLCASQDKTATLDCSQHQALCRNGKTPDWKVFNWEACGGVRPLEPQTLWQGGLRSITLRPGLAALAQVVGSD